MKLQQIITFVTVYQERSFTAAAERIHATQSGLSMQIRELEDRIGVKLFDRSPKGVDPTAAGERLYRHALELMKQVDVLRHEMAAIRGDVTGTVKAGLMPTFTRAALAPAIAKFADEFPYVKLEITEAYSGVLSEMVARNELDCAIVPPAATTATEGLDAQHIARDREMFVTCTGTSVPHMQRVRLADMGPIKLIVPTLANARRRKIDRYLATVGAEVQAIMEMDAMMATLSLIEHSEWTAILPSTLCFPDMEGRERKLHPLSDPDLSVDYVLIQRTAT